MLHPKKHVTVTFEPRGATSPITHEERLQLFRIIDKALVSGQELKISYATRSTVSKVS